MVKKPKKKKCDTCGELCTPAVENITEKKVYCSLKCSLKEK